MSRPVPPPATGAAFSIAELARTRPMHPHPYTARTFEPRIVRGTPAPSPIQDSVARLRAAGRRGPVRRTSATAPAQPPAPHSLVPSASATAPPFPPPTYLEHSALRHLLQTELPPVVPTRYARRADTPSTDSDDDSVIIPIRPAQAPAAQSGPSAPVLRLPTRWSDQDRHQSVNVSPDGRELAFHGPSSNGEKEAAAARTNHPIPAACGIYYYEVEILSKGTKGHISIGFSGTDVRLSRLPGWEQKSWGYHGDDGSSFAAEKNGTPYGPTFGTNDIIGCGIDFSQYRAFYTKNGTFLGPVFEGIGRDFDVYPSVGLRHSGEVVRVNFGHEGFKYDIDGHVLQQRNLVWAHIQLTRVMPAVVAMSETGLDALGDSMTVEGEAKMCLTSVRPPEAAMPVSGGSAGGSAVRAEEERSREAEELKRPLEALVLDFLEHHGYAKTARAFRAQHADAAMDTGAEDARARIVGAVARGDVDAALAEAEARCPGALAAEGGLVRVRLRCRRFVEQMLGVADAHAVERALLAGAEADGSGAMEVDGPSPPPLSASPVVRDGIRTAAAAAGPHEARKAYERSLGEALAYGKALRADYKDDKRAEVQSLLSRSFSVIAYSDPRAKHVPKDIAELVSDEARAALAEDVNRAILESQGRPAEPAIERMYRQAGACTVQLGMLGVGAAAFADMSKEFLEA